MLSILISNDDGIFAPGIKTLTNYIKQEYEEVIVASCFYERSTTGHSLTLHQPVRFEEIDHNKWATTGTPADAVYIALHVLYKYNLPDIVVSGINRGPNIGIDIYYSGTVAAAREAMLRGVPSLAVSLAFLTTSVEVYHYYTAAVIAMQVLKYFEQLPDKLKKDFFVNLNVPNIPLEYVKGIKVAKLGRLIYNMPIISQKDPRGKKYYWLGGYLGNIVDEPGTDAYWISRDYATVTPLSLDTFNYKYKLDGIEDIKIRL